MGLIKSTAVPTTAAPFSMADIERAARRILLRAQQQAEQLLAAAQAEAEQLKADARAQGLQEGKRDGLAAGLADGRSAGQQQALEESRAQLQQALSAMTGAAAELNAQRIELETIALQDVVKLSIAIARRVTKRVAALDPAVLAANLEEAMKLVMRQSDLRIAINPAQRATLDAALPKLALSWPALQHVEIVQDDALAAGGCRIFTQNGQIDADLETQLDLVVAELLPQAASDMSSSAANPTNASGVRPTASANAPGAEAVI